MTGFEVFPAYSCKCVTLMSLSANGKYAILRFLFVRRSQIVFVFKSDRFIWIICESCVYFLPFFCL